MCCTEAHMTDTEAAPDGQSDGCGRRILGAPGHGDDPPIGGSRRADVSRRRAAGGEDRQRAARRRAAGHRDAEAERLRGAPQSAQGRAHQADARGRGQLEEPGKRSRLGHAPGCGRVPAEALHVRATPHDRPSVSQMTTSLLDSSAAVRACVFTLAGEPFAIDVTQVREVAIFEDWTTVPLAPPHLVGVANLRGDIVPIADPRVVLGLAARRSGRKLPTLIIEAEGFEVALVIDGDVSLEAFGGITTLDESSPPPYAQWALGLLPDGERLVPLLDPGRILRALREERREER